MAGALGKGSLVAVVGIGCRLPGAPDPESFWTLLSEGRDAVGEISSERLDLAGCAEEERALWGSESGARFGAFLDDVEGFDPAFFGISPREAAAMDPQQRLALELAWEALEDAGTRRSLERRRRPASSSARFPSDYATLLDRYGAAAVDRHSVTGLQRGIIANRVSYVLGLAARASPSTPPVLLAGRGPPCLREPAAGRERARAGRRGPPQPRPPRSAERLALRRSLAGRPLLRLRRPRQRLRSRRGRRDRRAQAAGGGSARLATASTARSAAARSTTTAAASGLTAPSRVAQEGVLQRAWRGPASTRPTPSTSSCTAPAPRSATRSRQRRWAPCSARDARAGRRRCAVGSAKTNIGHLEGAAGIAGLIKAALAIERRRLPASLNFERPNPEIPLERARPAGAARARAVARREPPAPRRGQLLRHGRNELPRSCSPRCPSRLPRRRPWPGHEARRRDARSFSLVGRGRSGPVWPWGCWRARIRSRPRSTPANGRWRRTSIGLLRGSCVTPILPGCNRSTWCNPPSSPSWSPWRGSGKRTGSGRRR